MRKAFVLHTLEPYLFPITRFIFHSALEGENRNETMPMPDNFFEKVSEYGCVELLEYFKDHIDSTSVSSDSRYPIDYASQYCHTDVLDWWKNSEKPFLFSTFSLDLPCSEHSNDNIDPNASNVARYLQREPTASVQKQLKRLNWWLSSGLTLRYSAWVIDKASGFGWIIILDRWLESGLELKYTSEAMDVASQNGCIESLKWWKSSKLPLKHSENAMDLASEHGHIDILQWWEKSGLLINNTKDSLNLAKNTQVLDWWRYSSIEFNYSSEALTIAASDGDISKLEWWWGFDRKLFSGSEVDVIKSASEYNQPTVLQWLYENLDEFAFSADAIDTASQYSNIEALEWWRNSGLELKYTENSMLCADHWDDEEELMKVLNWWKESGLPLQYDKRSITMASQNGNVKILQWWLNSGLFLRYDESAMDVATCLTVLDWWVQSGLELRYTRYNPERQNKYVSEWWQRSGLDDL